MMFYPTLKCILMIQPVIGIAIITISTTTIIITKTIFAALIYIIILLVNPIYRILGRRGSMGITRVFAVIVAAYAVQ